MTTEEVGAYILLLCKSWREKPPGSLPSDDPTLARWARLPLDRWLVCRPGVLAAYTFGTDSRWHQKRLRTEYDKLISFRKSRQSAAVSMWEKKKLHARAVHEQCIPSSSSFSLDSKEDSKPSAPTKTVGASDGFLCFWDTYPRKVDRKEALRGWVKGLCDNLLGEILVSLSVWKQTEQWQDIEKVPYPSTWINKQRWKETPESRVSRGEQKARNTDAAIERVRQRLTNSELA